MPDRFFLRPGRDTSPLSPSDWEMTRSFKVVISVAGYGSRGVGPRHRARAGVRRHDGSRGGPRDSRRGRAGGVPAAASRRRRPELTDGGARRRKSHGIWRACAPAARTPRFGVSPVRGRGPDRVGHATRLREESVDVNLELRAEVDHPVGDRRRDEPDRSAGRVARARPGRWCTAASTGHSRRRRGGSPGRP